MHRQLAVRVACDDDFAKQIGNTKYFDLVDFNQVRSYKLDKSTTFGEFQQQVCCFVVCEYQLCEALDLTLD